MERGYIKIWRKIEHDELFFLPETFQLFCYLCIHAAWKDEKFRGVELKRGQLSTGRSVLAKALKQKEVSTYKRLQWLQKKGYISLSSNNKMTVVTICNYDTYQDQELVSEQRGNNEVTTRYQRDITIEEVKEVKEYYYTENPQQFLRDFKGAYPKNHGAYGPELENQFAIILRDQPSEEVEKIIPAARLYAEYWELKEPEQYPNCKYIKQARNWLRSECWRDGWGAKVAELRAVSAAKEEERLKDQEKLQRAAERERKRKDADRAYQEDVDREIEELGIETDGKSLMQIAKEVAKAKRAQLSGQA